MNDLELLTMLAVRLRSRGTETMVVDTAAELDGQDRTEVAERVGRLLRIGVDAGRFRRRGDEGRHALTPTGEAELNARLAADLTGPERADATVAYEAFLPLNRRFLAACVAWQDAGGELDVFVALVAELVPILDSLAEIRHRFAGYAPRLVRALGEAAGDRSWIESPTRDSVHTVWFELHEHLLATLGRERADEPGAAR